MATRRKTDPKHSKKRGRRWSHSVTEHSAALDLEPGVFTRRSARSIARSLKQSAENSSRRKSSPFRSAMSMLTFYGNRAGSNLSADQIEKLEQTKVELRHLFGRENDTRPDK
jgi:hypothetical protein